MKRIFYGLAGDGLGHASRTQAILEYLPDDIEVHLFTFGQAYKLFKEMNYPHLHEIEGLMWHNKRGGISVTQTLWKDRKLLLSRWKKSVQAIHELSLELKPNLYISDFEPSVARASHLSKTPLLSIDNQHRFSHCYWRDLPWRLQLFSVIIGASTKFLVPKADKVVISTFHKELLRSTRKNVYLADGLVRKSIESQEVSDANFVLVYARHGFSEPILKSLLNSDNTHFRVYGATEGSIQSVLVKRSNFEFFPLSQEFTKDLARCSKVIAPSGHQLITEVKYFGKKILTIPQAGQWEQYINAHYVNEMGMGKMCHLNKLNYDVVKNFLEEETASEGCTVNGVHKVNEVIMSYF